MSGGRGAARAPDGEERRAFRVVGRVQGVGFRWYTVGVARELGLRGSVKNRRDGSVEVHAQGAPADLEELARRLGLGPAAARVDRVEPVASSLPIPSDGFDVVR